MRPLAIMLGTPRDARARRKFGQSSVSIPTKKRGRTAPRARRTGPGRSIGKYRCVATRPSSPATMRAPVGVTVVTTMPRAGQRPRMPRTSGAAAAASPTETAWIQQRGSAGNPGSIRPSRCPKSCP